MNSGSWIRGEHVVDRAGDLGGAVVERIPDSALDVTDIVHVDPQHDLVEATGVLVEPLLFARVGEIVLAVHGNELDAHLADVVRQQLG